MKKELILFMSMLLSMAFLTGCDSKDEFEPFSPPDMGGMGNSSGGGEGTVTGLTDFTISFDSTPLANQQRQCRLGRGRERLFFGSLREGC